MGRLRPGTSPRRRGDRLDVHILLAPPRALLRLRDLLALVFASKLSSSCPTSLQNVTGIAVKNYLFAERLASKERQIWPSRTRSHCRAQIEFVMFAGN